MFSPFVFGICTDWPDTFCEVDSIWYDAIAFGSSARSTPANSSIRPMVSSVSIVRYSRLVSSRAVATLGENGPRPSTLATRATQEVLLARDPAEVGRAVGLPFAVDEVLVVPRPHVGERVVAVELEALAAGRRHVEPGVACRAPGTRTAP